MQESTSREYSSGRLRFQLAFPVAGYAVAQIVVLFLWIVMMWDGGIGVGGSPNDETLRIFRIAAVLPAVVVGVLDGAARASGRFVWKLITTVLLLALTVLWIAPLSIMFQSGEDMFYGPPPSWDYHVAALTVSEFALGMEWLVASTIWLPFRLLRRRRT